jgi:hypothetical protein
MITETKEVYKCGHCRKLYQIKNACERHEKMCTRNPDNHRACHDCTVLKKVKETIYDGYDVNGDEGEIEVGVLYCSKLDTFIHPPKVEIKGTAFEIGHKSNLPMPKECDKQEKIDRF